MVHTKQPLTLEHQVKMRLKALFDMKIELTLKDLLNEFKTEFREHKNDMYTIILQLCDKYKEANGNSYIFKLKQQY